MQVTSNAEKNVAEYLCPKNLKWRSYPLEILIRYNTQCCVHIKRLNMNQTLNLGFKKL